MQRFLLLLFLCLSALPAQAQVATSYGNRLGYECFTRARFPTNDAAGLDVCNLALRRDVMNVNDRAATHDNRGIILDRMGRIEEAEADFTRAIALKPDLGDAYVNRGAVLIRRKLYDEALAEIDRGMALGISFREVGEYNRAVALQLLGRYREAYEGYRRALAIEPGFALASERLKDFVVVRRPTAVN